MARILYAVIPGLAWPDLPLRGRIGIRLEPPLDVSESSPKKGISMKVNHKSCAAIMLATTMSALYMSQASAVCITYENRLGTYHNIGRGLTQAQVDNFIQDVKDLNKGKNIATWSVIVKKQNDGTFNVDPIDDVYFYSDTLNLDAIPILGDNILASPGAGAWSYEYTTIDHHGAPLARTGIRFFLSSGDGISPNESALFAFILPDTYSAATNWFADIHDSASNTWSDNVDCPECVPEIDAASAPGALTLLAGALGLVAERRRARPAAKA